MARKKKKRVLKKGGKLEKRYLSGLSKKDKAKNEQDKKDAEALEKHKLDLQKKGYSMAKGLFSENEKVQKAFALGEIAVDTARAISSLTANSEANPGNALTFGGAGIAQFAVGMLRILANIKNAKELLKNKSATPSASTDSGGGSASAPSTPAPSTPAQTPQFDLAGSVEMFQQQPVQAYVIQQDVQEQTELNEQIQNRATL